jgi:Fe2+ transport system protein FeoA
VNKSGESNPMQAMTLKSLASVNKDFCANVRLIEGGRGIKARLSSMGIIPGVVVEILANTGQGPIIAKVMGTQLALGRAMASKIYIDRLKPR